MLTGDKAQVAQAVAQQLGVDEVHAELPGRQRLSKWKAC